MFDRLRRSAPLFLASVTSADEAVIARDAGADIIDCKAPANGALGALPQNTVRDIVSAVGATTPVSATIGDLPAKADIMVAVSEAMSVTGVPIIKIGFFGDGDARSAIRALKSARLGQARLYAVLMADRAPDFSLIGELAAAGFLGVMLDTADKSSGTLPDVMAPARTIAFLEQAHGAGLIAGLAGSLRRSHIAGLTALRPGILGFRGALCSGGRTGRLEASLVKAVREDIDAAKANTRLTERSVA